MEEIETIFDKIRGALSFEELTSLNSHINHMHTYADSALNLEMEKNSDITLSMAIRLVHMYCHAIPVLRPIKKPDQKINDN